MEHGVANMAFYAVDKLENKPSGKLYEEWRRQKYVAIRHDISQTAAYTKLIDEFSKAGIPVIEAQGTVIKPLYPKRDQRTMADIDFIINRDSLDRAEEILTSLSYKCVRPLEDEVNGTLDPTVHIELHTDFFDKNSEYMGMLGDPFENAIKKGDNVYVPSDEKLYAYSVMHFAKHYFHSGCGIRRVMDLYVLNQNYTDAAKSEYVKKIFAKAGILQFWERSSKLADAWFGNGEMSEEFERMAQKIKAGATHGTAESWLTNSILSEKKQGKRFVRLRRLLKAAFPGMSVMSERFPVLKKHPWLIGFMWIYKNILAVTVNRRQIKKFCASVINSDSDDRV